MTSVWLPGGDELVLGDVLAAAGEGAIHEIVGRRGWVAKIFHPDLPLLSEKLEKVIAMTATRPDGAEQRDGFTVLTWPLDVVRNGDGCTVGYVMSRVDTTKAVEIHVLSNPSNRANPLPSAPQWPRGATWAHLVSVATNLCGAVESVHGVNAVIGDFQERNVLVTDTTRVTLVDCDSMQFTDADGRQFLCSVGRPEFTAPELADLDLRSQPRTRSSDLFALAVHIHLLLMGGNHPFLRGKWTGSGEQPSAMKLAKDGHWAGGWESQLQTHPLAPPPSFLPVEVRQLFLRAFTIGAHDPEMRPGAGEWRAALTGIRTSSCPSGRHDVPVGCARCPWCVVDAERSQLKRRSAAPASAPARVEPPQPAPMRERTASSRSAAVVTPRPPSPQRRRTRRWLAAAIATTTVGAAIAIWSVVATVNGVYDRPGGAEPPIQPSNSPGAGISATGRSAPEGAIFPSGDHPARCDPGDESALAGRTATLAFVVCRGAIPGALYYEQIRLEDGFVTRADFVTATWEAYETQLNGRRLLIGDRELTLTWQGEIVAVEEVLESWVS